MMGYNNTSFQLSALSLALMLSSATFALEKLDENELAYTTGEGLAFALNDFSVQFNGVDNTADTGYVRLIPVGPQSQSVINHNIATANANGTESEKSRAKFNTQIGKGDAYLYGLAISGNDGDTNTRFSGNNVNIGSFQNPWMIMATSENVVNFAGNNSPLSYFLIEAPEFDYEKDDYNLKFGLWTDIFVRDPAIEERNAAQFRLNGGTRSGTTYIDSNNDGILEASAVNGQTRENRARLQMVLNGASINGSSVKLFQTLGGATGNNGMSTNYNNTLGLAVKLRLNTGDSSNLKATLLNDTVSNASQTYSNNWTTVNDGAGVTYGTGGSGCGNGTSGAFSTAVTCRYNIQTRNRTDTATRTTSWALPDNLNDRVLRISTQETDNSYGLLNTPALNGGNAPKFASDEGLYLYNPNINLVLGSSWQPLTFSVANDNRNFVMEIARIANVASVYNEIYADYFGNNPALKGGTCSIYWCGDDNKNATHSSITIGTTDPYGTAGAGRLSAYKGVEAIGVSFGSLGTTNTVTNTVNVTELRYKERRLNTQTWRHTYDCGILGIGGCEPVAGYLYQWEYTNNGSNWQVISPTNKPADSSGCFLGICGSSGSTPMYGNAGNRNWNNNNYWLSTPNKNVEDLVKLDNIRYNTNSQATTGANAAFNNLGSASIDGVLIQHFKFTTKGL